MGLYAAAGAILIGLAVMIGARSSSSRLDTLERRGLKTQRELDRTKHKLEETTRAFEAYREQHAIVVTDESLQEEVRRALDVVAKTTRASEARQNATAELLVRTGQKVRRGQVISRGGSTGSVDKPQLHFELRRGNRAVNPERYLSRQRVSLH